MTTPQTQAPTTTQVAPPPAAPADPKAVGADPAVKVPEASAEPEKKPEDSKAASKFAALSRREKQVLEKERALKDREAKVAEFDRDQALKESDPLAWAEKHGLSYGKLTEQVLKGKPDPTAQKVKELEERLKRDEEAKLEAEKQAEQAKLDRALEDFRGGIKAHLGGNADALELLNAREDAVDVVLALIDQHFTLTEKESGTGRIMSIKEAAEMVEAHLVGEAEKLLKLKKFAPKSETEAKPGQKASVEQKPTRTLTNAMQAETPTQTEKPLTREESLAKAASLLKWVPKA